MPIKLSQPVPARPLAYAVLRNADGAEIGRLRAPSVGADGRTVDGPAGATVPAAVASLDLVYLTSGALYGVPVAKE